MKEKIDPLEFQKEILNIPIGDEVKDKKLASDIRSKVLTYSSPNDAVIAAIRNKDINLLQFLFGNSKADPTAMIRQNILHFAAESGNLEVIKYILDNITNIDPTAKSRDKKNILHFATASGNVEVMDYIIKNITKIDPTDTDKYGENILHYAVFRDNPEVMDYIIKNITKIDQLPRI